MKLYPFHTSHTHGVSGKAVQNFNEQCTNCTEERLMLNMLIMHIVLIRKLLAITKNHQTNSPQKDAMCMLHVSASQENTKSGHLSRVSVPFRPDLRVSRPASGGRKSKQMAAISCLLLDAAWLQRCTRLVAISAMGWRSVGAKRRMVAKQNHENEHELGASLESRKMQPLPASFPSEPI